MIGSCRTSSIPTRSTCSTRRASNMHKHSSLRCEVLKIAFAHFPRPQCSSHHFAYIQIPMFTGPIASHPFLGIASHNFQVQSSSRLHGFTFLRSLRFTLFPGCFFFFQIASHPFLAIPSHHFTVSKDSFAGSKGSHHLRVSTASFIFQPLLHIILQR